MPVAGTSPWRSLFAASCAAALLLAACEEPQSGTEPSAGSNAEAGAEAGVGAETTQAAPESIPPGSGPGITFVPGQGQGSGMPLLQSSPALQVVYEYDGLVQEASSVSNGQYLPVWSLAEDLGDNHSYEVSIVDLESMQTVAHYQAPPDYSIVEAVPYDDHAVIFRQPRGDSDVGFAIELTRLEYEASASTPIELPEDFLWAWNPVVVGSALVSAIVTEDGQWCLAQVAGTGVETLRCLDRRPPYSLNAASGGVTLGLHEGDWSDSPEFWTEFFPLDGGPSVKLLEGSTEPVLATMADDWAVWFSLSMAESAIGQQMRLWAKGTQTPALLIAESEYYGFVLCGNHVYWSVNPQESPGGSSARGIALARYELGAQGVELVYQSKQSSSYVSPPRCFEDQLTFTAHELSQYQDESLSTVYVVESKRRLDVEEIWN